MNKNISIIVFSLVMLVLVVFAAMNLNQDQSGCLPKEEAVNKAMDYIKKNLVEDGMEVSLAQIYSEDSPYYKFQIDIMGSLYDSIVTTDGALLFTNAGFDLNEKLDERVEGSFYVKEDAEIITEDGKPVVYLFTTAECGHCAWEKPVLAEALEQFGDEVVYKLNEDGLDDMDVYEQFGTGGVPLIVLGGKYYREGSGANYGEELEKEYLTNYICDLTGGIPEDICQ
ncbi:MAG: thioredoxin family protein [Candidatus Paceibacterota bacterium]